MSPRTNRKRASSRPLRKPEAWAKVSSVGIIPKRNPTVDELADAFLYFCAGANLDRWALGDLYLLMRSLGLTADKIYQRIPAGLLSLRRVQTYASVCASFPVSRRRENISIAHHEILTSLPPHRQESWLERAAREDLTDDDLRELTAGERDRAAGKSAPLPIQAAEKILARLFAIVSKIPDVPARDRFLDKLQELKAIVEEIRAQTPPKARAA